MPSDGEFFLHLYFRWDSRLVTGSTVGTGQGRGCHRLPYPLQQLHNGRVGVPSLLLAAPPCRAWGRPLYAYKALGTQRGTAARNPSMCHVRSKLWFSLWAWLSLPSGRQRKGSGGAAVGAQGLQRQPPPPRPGMADGGVEHSAHDRVSLQGSPSATQHRIYPDISTPTTPKAQGRQERV